MFAEKIEIDRILSKLSKSVGNIAGALELNIEYISVVDSFYARAIYSYKNKNVKPDINNKGIIDIVKGRHPLIDAEKVIPLSFKLGEINNFLLISGPNTGGKTVSLKMTGLFSLMAMCGIFIPCVSSNISVFDEIFCDIGDLQSIENNLSTFSSHIKSLKNITENVNENSLVLIDELGDGTDPDEGQALALSIIEFLIEQKCKGIITTHFSSLKEFAFNNSAIKNASMEFDMQTLTPLYKVIEGIPGSSNAIAISKRLGLDSKIIERAKSYLSVDKISFENILNKAEETRINAERELSEIRKTKNEIEEIKKELINEKEKLKNEREKIALSSRIEIRRIINDKADEAEELLDKIQEIFNKQEYDSGDIILAKTLKNKLLEKKYFAEENEAIEPDIKLVKLEDIKTGLRVYIKSLDNYGIISNISYKKNEAEIFIGNIRYTCRFNDIYFSDMNNNNKETKNKKIAVLKQSISSHQPVLEINVLGKNVFEAIDKVDTFIDKAIIDSLSEIKVIHGVGTGKLRLEIRKHLKSHPNVENFRAGKYGEGENGVTFITLK